MSNENNDLTLDDLKLPLKKGDMLCFKPEMKEYMSQQIEMSNPGKADARFLVTDLVRAEDTTWEGDENDRVYIFGYGMVRRFPVHIVNQFFDLAEDE